MDRSLTDDRLFHNIFFLSLFNTTSFPLLLSIFLSLCVSISFFFVSISIPLPLFFSVSLSLSLSLSFFVPYCVSMDVSVLVAIRIGMILMRNKISKFICWWDGFSTLNIFLCLKAVPIPKGVHQ